MEQTHRVGAATDASNQRVGQTTFGLQYLLFGFASDHRLEITDHRRIGMGAGNRADNVKGIVYICLCDNSIRSYIVYSASAPRVAMSWKITQYLPIRQ